MNEKQKQVLVAMVNALVPLDYRTEAAAAARELLIAAGSPDSGRVAVAMVRWVAVVKKAGCL